MWKKRGFLGSPRSWKSFFWYTAEEFQIQFLKSLRALIENFFRLRNVILLELWCRLSAAFWNVICSLTSIIIPLVFLTFLALYEIMRHSLHLQQLWVLLQNFNSLIFVSNFIPAIYLFILIVQFGNKLLSLLNNETRLALIFLQNGNKVH